MYCTSTAIALTTASDGSATGKAVLNGRLLSIHYIKTDFDNNSTFTITNETTGQNVWVETGVSATAHRAPRQPTHGQDGTASLHAAAGEPVEDYIFFANDPIKIVIASGGSTKTGTFIVVTG